VDSDGDGVSDTDEQAAGTNPHDPNSKPGGSADKDGDGLTDDKDRDADGDGVSTANEKAMGTDPFDASSFTKLAMNVTKAQGKLNFVMTAHDTFSVSGIIPGFAAGFQPAGELAVLKLNGAATQYALGATGRATSTQGSLQLKLKSARDPVTRQKVFLGGDVAFKAAMKAVTLTAALGVDPTLDAVKQNLPVVVDLQVNGNVYTCTVTTVYSAKANKGATLKK
jgi:hypothetical protein